MGKLIAIALGMLIGISVVTGCILEDCMEIKKKLTQVSEKMMPPSTRVFSTSIKGIKEIRSHIDIPLEHECLVTDTEMKDALLQQMIPMLIDQVEVMTREDFLTMKKEYLGRIKVVEVK